MTDRLVVFRIGESSRLSTGVRALAAVIRDGELTPEERKHQVAPLHSLAAAVTLLSRGQGHVPGDGAGRRGYLTGHRQLGRRPGDWGDRWIVCVEGRGGWLVCTGAPSYKGFRFPAEIINHCVWLSYRFPLSFREVEEMMLQRGIVVSHETVWQWCAKFGQTYANVLRRWVPEVGRIHGLVQRGDPRDLNDRVPCRCACFT